MSKFKNMTLFITRCTGSFGNAIFILFSAIKNINWVFLNNGGNKIVFLN